MENRLLVYLFIIFVSFFHLQIRKVGRALGTKYELIRFIKMIFYVFYISHIIACGWWIVGEIEGYGSDKWVPSNLLLYKSQVCKKFFITLFNKSEQRTLKKVGFVYFKEKSQFDFNLSFPPSHPPSPILIICRRLYIYRVYIGHLD